MNRPFTLASAALTLLVLAAAPVCADPIYSYSWGVNSSVTVSNGGSISFSGFGSSPMTQGSTNTIAAYVTPVVSGSGPFSITSGAYTATISITDAASHLSGSLTFSGVLGGGFTTTGSSTTDTILGVTDAGGFHAGVTSDLLNLGGTVYAVSYNGYVPPGGKPEGSKGPIGFNISVISTAGGDPGTAGGPSGTPEPSSMLLAGLGAAFTGLAAWRRRRAARLAA